MISEKKRFEVLDSFRGLCAIFVLIYHLHLIGTISQLKFFKGSFIFVEFFFILSGFVLAHSYAFKENLSFKKFLKGRFFRIYPLHLFMFIVMLIFEIGKLLAFKYGGYSFNNQPFTNQGSIYEIIPNLLLIQSWTSYTNSHSFNSPSWSISIEFYLYIFFYFTILALRNFKIISWLLISLLAFIFIFFNIDILQSSVLRGLSCFFGGAFTYIIYRRFSNLFFGYILGSFIESILVICNILIVQSEIVHKSLFASIVFLCTIFFFAFESGLISKFLKKHIFIYLGKLSYSIYMTHWAVLFCLLSLAMVFEKITGLSFTLMNENVRYMDFGNNLINNLIMMFIICLVILISNFTYKYIEIPGQKLNRKP